MPAVKADPVLEIVQRLRARGITDPEDIRRCLRMLTKLPRRRKYLGLHRSRSPPVRGVE